MKMIGIFSFLFIISNAYSLEEVFTLTGAAAKKEYNRLKKRPDCDRIRGNLRICMKYYQKKNPITGIKKWFFCYRVGEVAETGNAEYKCGKPYL